MHLQFMIKCFAWQSFAGNLFHITAFSVWMSFQRDSLVQRSLASQPQPKRIDLNGTKSMSWVAFYMNKSSYISHDFLLKYVPSHTTFIDTWFDQARYLCAWSISRPPYHILLCLLLFADLGTSALTGLYKANTMLIITDSLTWHREVSLHSIGLILIMRTASRIMRT